MTIAIDDTYGPETVAPSIYVTGARRTHVAVVFDDSEVVWLRQQVRGCLELLRDEHGIQLDEFHFSEMYNRSGVWADARAGLNLFVLEFFANCYCNARWRVFVQTIDDRTFAKYEDNINELGKIPGFDFAKREHQSLFFLLVKVKRSLLELAEPVLLLVDEGTEKAGTPFPKSVFRDWPYDFEGTYCSSKDEPLLQIADFIAFVVNRSTNLGLKGTLTETDLWFLELIADMNINSNDLQRVEVQSSSMRDEIDRLHAEDIEKKLQVDDGNQDEEA